MNWLRPKDHLHSNSIRAFSVKKLEIRKIRFLVQIFNIIESPYKCYACKNKGKFFFKKKGKKKANLQKEFEIFAYGKKIQLMIKTKNVDPTAGTPSVKDNNVIVGRFIREEEQVVVSGPAAAEEVGGRGVGGDPGHEEEDEGDEEEGDGKHKNEAAVAMDLVR